MPMGGTHLGSGHRLVSALTKGLVIINARDRGGRDLNGA